VAIFLALPSRSRLNRALILFVGLVLVVLSRSAGALAYFGVVVLVPMLAPVLRWKALARRVAITALLVTVTVGAWITVANLRAVTSFFGRDPSLTGRVDLWTMSFASIEQQPILGYGYHAFWTENSPHATRIREEVNWDAPHSHNGYIDLLLSLGLTGFGFYMLAWLAAGRRACRFARIIPLSCGTWPASFLVLILVYQLTEASIVTGNWILWIIYVAISFALSAAEDRSPHTGERAVEPFYDPYSGTFRTHRLICGRTIATNEF
jgi:exopolysaccharide production protein ExoQ